MADPARIDVDGGEGGAKRGGMLPLLAGLGALLLLGGGGFYATYSGLLALPFGGGSTPPEEVAYAAPMEMPSFVPIEQLTVSLGPEANAKFLRLSAALEVEPGSESDVRTLMPRILDVMNTYLQALDETDVERGAAMSRMRSHLLRRIRIVTGEGRVRDLLVTEFILQ
ncbi:MAG: flagellar basal body-associated FliL family protein [Pseudomonadota bacterium]